MQDTKVRCGALHGYVSSSIPLHILIDGLIQLHRHIPSLAQSWRLRPTMGRSLSGANSTKTQRLPSVVAPGRRSSTSPSIQPQSTWSRGHRTSADVSSPARLPTGMLASLNSAITAGPIRSSMHMGWVSTLSVGHLLFRPAA